MWWWNSSSGDCEMVLVVEEHYKKNIEKCWRHISSMYKEDFIGVLHDDKNDDEILP
jgi:hypothetical protein